MGSEIRPQPQDSSRRRRRPQRRRLHQHRRLPQRPRPQGPQANLADAAHVRRPVLERLTLKLSLRGPPRSPRRLRFNAGPLADLGVTKATPLRPPPPHRPLAPVIRQHRAGHVHPRAENRRRQADRAELAHRAGEARRHAAVLQAHLERHRAPTDCPAGTRGSASSRTNSPARCADRHGQQQPTRPEQLSRPAAVVTAVKYTMPNIEASGMIPAIRAPAHARVISRTHQHGAQAANAEHARSPVARRRRGRAARSIPPHQAKKHEPRGARRRQRRHDRAAGRGERASDNRAAARHHRHDTRS